MAKAKTDNPISRSASRSRLSGTGSPKLRNRHAAADNAADSSTCGSSATLSIGFIAIAR
jgi:hypothetical protein